jgi:hydrogenase 3 maturation protease
MTSVHDFLTDALAGTSRLAILGAGSCLMADDAAGVLITDALIERFGEETEHFSIFTGSTAPECFTGVIKRFRPDHVLLIDAADIGGEPGELCSIDPTVVDGVSFSTHMLPLKVMLEYLNKEIGCRTTIIGIQPVSLDFDGDMTPAVKKTVDELTQALGEILANW